MIQGQMLLQKVQILQDQMMTMIRYDKKTEDHDPGTKNVGVRPENQPKTNYIINTAFSDSMHVIKHLNLFAKEIKEHDKSQTSQNQGDKKFRNKLRQSMYMKAHD